MYKGNNPTALKSQQWLTDALISLIKEIPYEQITIQAICKKAYLSRQTFYNFFDSKDDIIRFYIQEKYDELFGLFSVSPTMQQTIDALAFVLSEHKEILSILVKNNLDGIIADEMVKCVTKFAEKFILKNSEMDEKFYCSIVLLAGAFAHLILCIVKEEINISKNDFTELIKEFMKGELYELVDE